MVDNSMALPWPEMSSWTNSSVELLLGKHGDICEHASYHHRIDDPDRYNYCPIPESGEDAVLFASLGLLLAALLSGRLSALWVFIAGGALQLLNTACNMGPLSNAIVLWLGIRPADVFLYVFLPPLLLDSAVRMDYFVFRKVMLQVLTFAFLVVIASTVLMVPVLLYVFRLTDLGWHWQHAALFSSMVASTDAVAVSAILHSAGVGPALMAVLEGESLFNDASSITLFEVFLSLVVRLESGKADMSFGATALDLLNRIVVLSVGGALIGYAFGVATRYLLKWLQNRGAKPPQELAITLAMAYLAFYVANSPAVAGTSGVIAVVVMGIYGSATGKWDMSPRTAESGHFFSFWDTISFAVNGIVFFFAGASAVNFFVRSAEELKETGTVDVVFATFWRLPFIYIAMFLARAASIAFFKPLFDCAGSGMSWGVVLFTTFGGLRGAVSLILAQILVLDQEKKVLSSRHITAEIALWTSGFVVLTLIINAPLMPWLLKVTGVAETGGVKQRMRAKAARALVRYTQSAIEDLKGDEDEMLRGVDWNMVSQYVDISSALPGLDLTEEEDMEGVIGEGEGDQPDGSRGAARVAANQVQASEASWAERTGIAQAAAWSADRLRNMMGTQRSSAELPRWIGDTQSASFTAPLLRPVSERTESEDEDDDELHAIVTDHVSSSALDGTGPGNCGTRVMQPWPNNLADLEQAHGRFAEDLPFMGKDLRGDAEDEGGDEGGTGGGLADSSAYSQEMPPAAEAAGGHGGTAEAADALPIKTTPPQPSGSVRTPPGRGVIFEDTTALQSGSLGSGGAGAADFPRAISTVPDPDQAPDVGTGPVDYPGSIGGGGGSSISAVPDPDAAPPSHRPSVSFRDCGGPGGCGTDSDAGSADSQGAGGRKGSGRSGGGGDGDQTRESQSQEAQRGHAALDSVLNPQTAAWERHPERASSAAVRAASGVSSSTDSSGGQYLVMPQPVLVPRLGSTDEDSERQSMPTVSWQPVDLQRMLRRDAASGAEPPDDWAQPPTPQRAGGGGSSGGHGSGSLARASWSGQADSGIAGGFSSPRFGGGGGAGGVGGSGRGTSGIPINRNFGDRSEDFEGYRPSSAPTSSRLLSSGRWDTAQQFGSMGQRPSGMRVGSGNLDESPSRASQGRGGSAMDHGFHVFNTHEPGVEAQQTSQSAAQRYEALAPADASAMTAEARMRLLSGLKRYFHSKRAEGLLSGQGVRILDFACDIAMDSADEPLSVWSSVQAEVAGGKRVKLLASALFQTAVLGNWLRTTNIPGLRQLLSWPRSLLSRWLNSQLSSVMLVGIEAAVEFWLALNWSPQAQWLRYSDPSGCLLEEVSAESKRVWHFIIEREIEAPDRFQAIQSYRAAMAIMRQQARFIEQLYSTGMVDEQEKEELMEPVEARERALSRLGAVWRPPLLLEILHSLPFFANVPEPLFERVLGAGQLIMYTAGDVIWRPAPNEEDNRRSSKSFGRLSDPGKADGGSKEGGDREARSIRASHGGRDQGSQGVFVVLHGIVRSAYAAPDGTTSEYFLGRGGMFGLLPALTGEALPGARPVFAEGNLLRRGPVVFRIPPEVIRSVRKDADAGDPACEQLMLDLYRVAALYVAERMRNEVVATVAAHFQQLALAAARRRAAHAANRRGMKRHESAKPGKEDKKKEAKKEGDRTVEKAQRARTFLESEFNDAMQGAAAPQAKPKPQGSPEEERTQHGGVAASPFAAGETPSEQARARAKQEGDKPALQRGMPTDAELLDSMDPETMYRDVQKHASTVIGNLKAGLREAEVLELPPGASIKQRSSLVVLRGTLRATGHASQLPTSADGTTPRRGDAEASKEPDNAAGGKGGAGGEYAVLVQYHAPCVMPWLWDEAAPSADPRMRPSHIDLRAGSRGAIVVMCPPEHESDTETTSSDDGSGRGSAAAAEALSEAGSDASGGFGGAGPLSLAAGDPGAAGAAGSPEGEARRSIQLRRMGSMQRLPAMASTTGNDAVELSSFASGTGKSSAERLKVIQVTRQGSKRRESPIKEDES